MAVTRRTVLGAGAALPLAKAFAGADPIAALEAKSGGRLGIAVVDAANGRSLTHRAGERFAMCSTFKLLLCAAVLARIDAGKESEERTIAYGAGDLVTYSPVTEKHAGGMSVGTLLDAVLSVSDNTAANLLLKTIGGPAGWTAFAQSIGDRTSRLDRFEPELNRVGPGDERDTTTPAAMLQNLKAVMLGKVLTDVSRALLEDRMAASLTGANRLRAGVPASWRVADKTGSGPNARNDIALMRPPGRAPILACVYTMDTKLDDAAGNALIADVGRVIAGWARDR